ncbi:MAG: M23 family metallopeptidase [Balneolaceae bacterium]
MSAAKPFSIKTFWIILLMASFVINQEKEAVNIYRVEEVGRLKIFAKNDHIYPVTIEVDFDLKNLTSSRDLPFTGVLKPAANENILDLVFAKGADGWNYKATFKYYMGSIFAKHNDEFTYRLPFKTGKSYKLSQGFYGAHSHQGDLKYALDFDLGIGDEVYAARDGLVVALEDKNDRGGPLKKFMKYANFITIMHKDGTFADYSHLMNKGVTVEIGQKIKKGQLIGFSGATGFATGPHLHFAVKKAKKGGGYISVPVKFATKDGIAELQEGQSYIGF